MSTGTTKQWFLKCIGRRVFRRTKTACYQHCNAGYEHGLIIMDEPHANYLAACAAECGYVNADTKS
jgi:hypothetical protein